MPGPFTYPALPHQQRHGPQDYADYASYRPWLRDEFTFQCVYCLLREQWGKLRATFTLDHFHPVCHRPDLTTTYDNLLYACAMCNAAKGSQQAPDPCQVFLDGTVRVHDDGSIVANSPEARRLIRALGLDDPEYTEFRLLWIGIVQLAERHEPELYQQLMGFPADLPDLRRFRPPGGNNRPAGIEASYFRQREQGLLPTTY